MFIFILASASQPRSLSPLRFYTMWDGTSNSTFNHIQSSYSNYIFTDFTAFSQILGILSQVPTESSKRLGQVRTWSSLGLLWGEQSLDAFSRWGSRGPNLLALESKEVPGLYQGSLHVQRRTGHATLQDATEMGSEDASRLAWGTNKNRPFHAFQHLLMQVSKGFTRDQCPCPNVLNWTYWNKGFFCTFGILWLQSILHLTRDLMIFSC